MAQILTASDYRCCAGSLHMRAEASDRLAAVDLEGECWVPVRDVELRRDGTEVGAVRVFLRASRLPRDVGAIS